VQDNDGAGWNLESSYASLPRSFYAFVEPTRVRKPSLVLVSSSVADMLGLDALKIQDEAHAEIFAGNQLPPGSKPLAQAYAGHQFGGFTMLGDGRAILLGEQITPQGNRFDIQLKGPGPTPYSRRGDGRASLGPMLREFIISHAMDALDIPTTLSLAVAQTGEPVFRHGPEPGAVLTRVAASHIRVGTFQYAASRNDIDELRALADYAIERHYPELLESDSRYIDFLQSVIRRQAALVAKWMSVGFIHGVMNTDNVSIAGETIDYGPCAFMNGYQASKVFSSIDEQGRYAYGNQPSICQWNLARFAETLLPLLHQDIEQAIALATQVINDFPNLYGQYWLAEMGRKLGIEEVQAGDEPLISELLVLMEERELDFTNTFRELSEAKSRNWQEYVGMAPWIAKWRNRIDCSVGMDRALELMRKVNPIVIPRNHLVEAALEAAVFGRDLGPTLELLEVLSRPFELDGTNRAYQLPPAGGDGDYCTYCGT
jgi:serine/tyrosine/threonine adenylyltransferase